MNEKLSQNWCLEKLPISIVYQIQQLPKVQGGRNRQRLHFDQRLLSQKLASELTNIASEKSYDNAQEQVIAPIENLRSISHSGEIVLVAMARSRDVTHLGVDCEIVLDRHRADRLALRILSDKDRLEWPKSGLSWEEFVTLSFCIKEAAFKSLSKEIQKSLGFRSFSLEFDKNSKQTRFLVRVDIAKFLEPLVLTGQSGIFGKYMLCVVWRAVQG